MSSTIKQKQKMYTQGELEQQIAAIIGKERAKSEKALRNQEKDLRERWEAARAHQDRYIAMGEINKLRKQLEKEQCIREKVENDNRNQIIKIKAMHIFQERSLPLQMIDYVLDSTEESTIENIVVFEKKYKENLSIEVGNNIEQRLGKVLGILLKA